MEARRLPELRDGRTIGHFEELEEDVVEIRAGGVTLSRSCAEAPLL